MPVAPRVAPIRPARRAHPLPLRVLPFLFLVLMLALLMLDARPARAQAPPLPGETSIYLPFGAVFRVTQPIAAGGAHSCAVLPTGIVRCWGGNDHGQLGDGTTISSMLPVTVQGLSGVHAVAAGNASTCAAAGDGVYCWGDGFGLTPVRIEGVPRATQLAFWEGHVLYSVGHRQSCALGTDGSVICWAPDSPAVRVDEIDGATALASGVPCALVEGGGLRCWGGWPFGPEGGVQSWPGVSSATSAAGREYCGLRGCNYTLAVLSGEGKVASWFGQCGYSHCDAPSTPDQEFPLESIGVRAVALAGGPGGICALQDNGRVLCRDTYDSSSGVGGLGDSFTDGQSATSVEFTLAVAVGSNHACALGVQGISCWGSNEEGQLGSPAAIARSSVPLPVPYWLQGTLDAAADYQMTCNVGGQGNVACWGQSGNARYAIFAPQGILTAAPASAIDVGGGSGCALLPGIGIACWDADWSVTQGFSHIVPGAQDVTSLALAVGFGCFTNEQAQVWCWRGSWTGVVVPPGTTIRLFQVPGLQGVKSLAAGGEHACAVANGKVSCWTWPGPYPEVGLSSVEIIPGLSNVRRIAGGDTHTCALRSDGDVLCWSMSADEPTPVAASGVDHAIAIAASGMRTCALRNDGAVLCWDPANPSPTEIFRMQGATALTIGDGHACVTVDSLLYCQGDNSRGQLAQNPGWTPVRVEGLAP